MREMQRYQQSKERNAIRLKSIVRFQSHLIDFVETLLNYPSFRRQNAPEYIKTTTMNRVYNSQQCADAIDQINQI
jgi:hypothetical protein